MKREGEPSRRIDPRVEERLAIIEQSRKKLDDEAAARLIAQATREICDLMGWDKNQVEEELARYMERKRDPGLINDKN